MDKRTQEICISQTNAFYKKNAQSFSETRTSAWPGWGILTSHIQHLTTPLKVLDVACGNMRFEKFLAAKKLNISQATCIDNCPALIPDELLAYANYFEKDIYDLIEEKSMDKKYNLSVAFGLLHHIPTFEKRASLLKFLISSTQTGGIIAISCWNFLASKKIHNKAIKTTEIALEKLGIEFDDLNDYFLNWNDDYETFRYCHNFSNEECINLAKEVERKAILIDKFTSDGKSNNLNHYLVFQRI